MINKVSVEKLIHNSTVRKITGAMFTQGMLSILNLIIGILIARGVTKDEYALYVLAFNIIQGTISYQNALINSPLTILSPAKEPSIRSRFISGLAFGQWLYCLPILAIVLMCGAVFCLFTKDLLRFIQLLVLSFAIIASFFREFMRNVNYSSLHVRRVIIMDISFVFVVLPLIGLLAYLEKLSSITAVAILSGGSICSAIVGLLNNRIEYKIKFQIILDSLRESWQYARWALVGVTATILQGQGYLYVVSLTLGLHELADMAAARLFLMPIGLIIGSCGKILLAKGAHVLHNEGVRKLNRFTWAIMGILFVIWLGYAFLLGLTHTALVQLAFKGKYYDLGWYIFGWAVLFLMQLLRTPISNTLQVHKEFKPLAIYGLISSILTFSACIVLTQKYGAYGALSSLIFGELVLFLFCLWKKIFGNHS